mmetsp:Transcript_8872/g.24068  ORF Transcript_8872/g.24068 Transcript_8872/m.24068 type:complete len:280 (-) Transcript_8872:63-902(-)
MAGSALVYTVASKNAFIHVITPVDDAENDVSPVTLQHSAPPSSCTSRSASTSSRSREGGHSSSSSLTGMDKLLQPGSAQRDRESEASSGDDWDDKATGAAGASSGPRRRRNKRPRKAGRQKYRDVVDQHLEAIRNDPFGFDMAYVEIPAFISDNPRLDEKFRSRLQQYAETLRTEGAQQVPAASSGGYAGPHRAGASRRGGGYAGPHRAGASRRGGANSTAAGAWSFSSSSQAPSRVLGRERGGAYSGAAAAPSASSESQVPYRGLERERGWARILMPL